MKIISNSFTGVQGMKYTHSLYLNTLQTHFTLLPKKENSEIQIFFKHTNPNKGNFTC